MRNYLKLIIILVTCILFLVIFFIIKREVINPFGNVKDTDIAYITKIGGLPSNNCWTVLYPEKDHSKIMKLIKLINSSTNIREATKVDLQRNGYPVDILIKMKDGREFQLESAKRLTSTKVNNGMMITGTTYKDRFILSFRNNGKTKYYTLFSNEAAEYILNTSDADFPKVPIFSINPANIKLGDKVSIIGEGCTEFEVNVCLSNGNDADKEEYIIGKVKPVFGSWKWEGIIEKNMKTYDGKDIPLTNKKLFIEIKMGNRRTTMGEVISF